MSKKPAKPAAKPAAKGSPLMDAVAGLVKQINASSAAQAELEDWDRTMQFAVSDGQPFYVEFKAKKAAGPTAGTHSSPDITLESDTATFTGMLKGEIDATSAYMGGQLRIQGPLPDAIKFRTILESVRS
nr:SCP2 sterol-binding domain-containing protein [Candidatus Njordarchaeota archaeon]